MASVSALQTGGRQVASREPVSFGNQIEYLCHSAFVSTPGPNPRPVTSHQSAATGPVNSTERRRLIGAVLLDLTRAAAQAEDSACKQTGHLWPR